MHGVHVGFGEEGRRLRDGRWNEDLSILTRLADMAGSHEPSDVLLKVRPPKAFSNEGDCREDSAVRAAVVAFHKYCDSVIQRDDELVCT